MFGINYFVHHSNEKRLVFLKFLLLSFLTNIDTGAVDGKDKSGNDQGDHYYLPLALAFDAHNAKRFVLHKKT